MKKPKYKIGGHWHYPKEDDFTLASYKKEAIEVFEQFWKRKINSEEVKEFEMWGFDNTKQDMIKLK